MWRQVDICERGMMMAIPHTTSSLSSSSSSSSSTSLQGSKAVKDEIINYDAHKITPEMRARVAKLMDSKGNSFEAAVRAGAGDVQPPHPSLTAPTPSSGRTAP